MSARRDRRQDREAECLRVAAFHEAGHAVAALRQDVRVFRMEAGFRSTLFHGPLPDGVSDTGVEVEPKTRRDAFISATTYCAGPEAEALERHYRTEVRLPRCKKDAYAGAAHWDLQNARVVLRGNRGDLRTAKAQAATIVLHRWQSIEALALALAEAGSLSESEIRRIVQ